jgi:hypothetical protein
LFSHDGYLNALAPARRDHIDLTLPAVYNLKKKNGELIGTETRHFLSDISFGGNLKKYWKQYQWSNIFAMLRNQKLSPKICTDD